MNTPQFRNQQLAYQKDPVIEDLPDYRTTYIYDQEKSKWKVETKKVSRQEKRTHARTQLKEDHKKRKNSVENTG